MLPELGGEVVVGGPEGAGDGWMNENALTVEME
jgi:hypothetical protein